MTGRLATVLALLVGASAVVAATRRRTARACHRLAEVDRSVRGTAAAHPTASPARRAQIVGARGRGATIARCAGLALVGLLVGLPGVAAVLIAAWVYPKARARTSTRRRQRAVVSELPDVLDLLRISIESGGNLHGSLATITRHSDGVVVDALRSVLTAVDRGPRLGEALEAVTDLGDEGRPMMDALLAAERYGAPLAPALERAAFDARQQRRRLGEADARRTPIKMLFPLVLCTLPALGVLTVVPLLARFVPSFEP